MLLEQRPEVKVLFMSGYPSDILKVEGSAREDFEFLQKPLKGDLLFSRVRSIIQSSRQRSL